MFGFRHPVTSQSYVYPVLPFGFTLSPPLACRNTQLMATMIEAEMLARWKGRPGHPALRGVKRRTRGGGRTVGPAPASSVYVDDYANSASDAAWTQEIIEVSAEVFRRVGVVEKELKRE
eukprot:3938809-Rhodomonas_salina.1